MLMTLCGLGDNHSSGAALTICYRLTYWYTQWPIDLRKENNHLHCILYLTIWKKTSSILWTELQKCETMLTKLYCTIQQQTIINSRRIQSNISMQAMHYTKPTASRRLITSCIYCFWQPHVNAGEVVHDVLEPGRVQSRRMYSLELQGYHQGCTTGTSFSYLLTLINFPASAITDH